MKRLLTLFAAFVLFGHAALAQPSAGNAALIEAAAPICQMVEGSARQYGLPVPFLTRLVWIESAFQVDAISRAGAQGVAQFMPETASQQGLTDPLNPQLALAKAAEYLTALTRQFGNLGLAAAAYNGGPARVGRWLDGQGGLAGETRSYVLMITGRPVEDWATARRQQVALQPVPGAVADQSCMEQVKTLGSQGRPIFASSRVPARVPPFEARLAAYLDKVLAKRDQDDPAVTPQPAAPPKAVQRDAADLCASAQAMGMHCVVDR